MKIKLIKLMPMLLAFVIFSWISMPNLSVTAGVAEANFQLHKIFLKVIVLITVLVAFISVPNSIKIYINRNKPFTLLVLYAALISLRSPELIFSYTRLLDFVILSFCAYFLALYSTGFYGNQFKLKVMNILSFYVFSALMIYFIAPSWGAIGAGYDGISETYKLRLGGAFTRVDAIASLSSVCFLFWLLRKENSFIRFFYIASSFSVLTLTHSRSVMIAMIISLLFVYSRKYILKLFVISLIVIFIDVSFDGVFSSYLTRNESYENLITASGRLYTLISFFEANSLIDILLGNGFSMHSPLGRYIFVPEMKQYMSSAHNGYVSIILGAGIIGFILILWLHFIFFIRALRSKNEFYITVFITLSISTLFDYGIWGTASQSFLIFMYMHNLQGMTKYEVQT